MSGKSWMDLHLAAYAMATGAKKMILVSENEITAKDVMERIRKFREECPWIFERKVDPVAWAAYLKTLEGRFDA